MDPQLTDQDLADAKPFCEVLVASGLVSSNELALLLRVYCRAYAEVSARNEISLSEFLVARGILTEWQADKLRRRKYKGFFIHRFVVLNHVRTCDDHSIFAAMDTSTKRQVQLQIWPPVTSDGRYTGPSYRVLNQGCEPERIPF